MLTAQDIMTQGSKSGSGAFSEVYIMPNGVAAKVCDRANIDGWLAWAAYCILRRGDNHVPDIKGLRIDIKANQYTALLDSLIDVNDLRRFPDAARYEIWRKYADSMERLVNEARGYMQQKLECSLYRDFNSSHNWMVNEDHWPVVTDPFTYQGWYDCSNAKSAHPAYWKLLDFIREHPALRCRVEIVE